ncbi:MAG: AAA family ATPase [Candidatus Sumerlaeia bacterium]|nr:AAA family ATPase [Candidatus Sumerlaeia bacterium]
MNAFAQLMNKDLTKGRYLWLFDEVQKLRDCEEQIKRIYDNYANFKLIISGSESLFIRKRKIINAEREVVEK